MRKAKGGVSLAEWVRCGAHDARELRPFTPPDLSPVAAVLAYTPAELREAGRAYRLGFAREHERIARARLKHARSA